ncbi:MAG: DUF799 family lipoprotein [Deltaproteobacteria bacterium]|nr:DUF799 family lipoprotein [Deltaproteobacteria bacterium]
MNKILKWAAIVLLLPFMIPMQSCVVATKDTVVTPQIQSLFKGTHQIDPYMEKHIPLSVAVLPFNNQSESREGNVAVRKGFYNHFSSLPFKDMELYRIDALLQNAGLSDPKMIQKTSPQELGKILDVDAVIFGDISNFDKLFALIYSQVSVGAEIRMYDTKTGNFLWSGKHIARIHEGGLSTTPVGLIATVVATAMNVRDIQLLRACDDLFRDMVKTIPVPAIAEALRPPTISLLTQDSKNLPKKAGDEIKVVIQGTPKMRAHFKIGDHKTRIAMREMEPGGYLGVYKVLPGDNVKNAMITGYLTDDAGNTAEWVDAVGTVTLDTSSPEKIKNVIGVGRNHLNILRWEKSSASDLAGYCIYRSATPLSGFQAVGKTEFNEYRDEGLTNFRTYYYKITALDRAGNESETSDTLPGMPVAPGPTFVSGSIETDATWYSGASPYIIENTVTVKDKALLRIEPGTEIFSKGGALIVEGRLDAQGNGEHIISFESAPGVKSWDGIIFTNVKDKENVMRFCRIRNAAAGIACLNASPHISSCELAENKTAIKVTGAFSKPVITANTIQKNRAAAVLVTAGSAPTFNDNRIMNNVREGISVQGAAPSIVHNVITGNQGGGVSVRTSRAMITENNITDNYPFDMTGDLAGEAVHALNNWWGSADGLDVLKKIKGKIDIRSILSGPWPEGQSLKLPILSQVLKGTIHNDAFLILSNSPYHIVEDVIISGGATLYIEPGVVLQYDPNTSIITKDGGVIARGTMESPILFTASASSLSPGCYNSAVQLTQRTSINSAFAFCIVKYATTAFDIYYGTPEISLCHITQSAQSGIYCRNDTAPKILYNTFNGNLGEGAIKCVGTSNPSIHYNNFVDNTVAIQTFSTIHIDARHNWWGGNPPPPGIIWGDNINIKPWLEERHEKAFTATPPTGR